MRFWRTSIFALSLATASGALAGSAPHRNSYSPWLSPQLFGLLPHWRIGRRRRLRDCRRTGYEMKSQASFNRADADLQMNIAAAKAAGNEEDNSSEDQKAWQGLAERKISMTPTTTRSKHCKTRWPGRYPVSGADRGARPRGPDQMARYVAHLFAELCNLS